MAVDGRLQPGLSRSSTAWLSVALAASILGAGRLAQACDVCAIYTATEMRESRTGVYAGVAEQFTGYGTLQNNGDEVPNPAGERLNSSITQFIGGYTFAPWLAAQVNLPIIGREYRRQEAGGVVNGDESGLGDMSLLATAFPFSNVTENSVMRWSLTGGLKLPTGNSRRLKEELMTSEPVDNPSDPFNGRPPPKRWVKYHNTGSGTPPSGVHGHDLALGSGSTDAVLGTQLFGSWRRVYVAGAVQYVIRTAGSFGYEYANDLTWSGGPGVFAILEHDYTMGIQAVISGESKGNDNLNGVSQDDTARTGVYAGPELVFTWGTSLAANFAVDLPFVQNNSALQIVPDYRLRGSLTWRF
jgi:hypothetical protein